MRAQLAHVSQNSNPSARAWNISQGVQGCPHAVGVCVIGIVHDVYPAHPPDFQTHSGLGTVIQTVLNLDTAQSHLCPQGDGEQGITGLMSAYQRHAIIPRPTRIRRLHMEFHAMFIHVIELHSPVIVRAKAQLNNFASCPWQHHIQTGCVPVDKETALGWERLAKKAFLRGNASQITKKLQMLAAHTC